MAWSAVTWAYKDLVTSAKLAQMQENIRTHDHRSDGTQGDPSAIIAGPTWGAAAVTAAANPTTTTLANIVLPQTKRVSTLWVLLQFTISVAYQRLITTFAPIDSRMITPAFAGWGTNPINNLVGSAVAGCQTQVMIGYPINVGAATGTSMAFAISPVGGNATECRALWWVDS